jgi:hypothetical protein
MPNSHPKSVRRKVLQILYQHYMDNPHDMLTPNEILAHNTVTKVELIQNIFYLSDRKLVELMLGYNPPTFDAVRITVDGIDLVEDTFEFDLRFPPDPADLEEALGRVPILLEQLVAEADYTPIDGEERRRLLRDVQFLRDEIARPTDRWRKHVIDALLDWIQADVNDAEKYLPSATEIRAILTGQRFS